MTKFRTRVGVREKNQEIVAEIFQIWRKLSIHRTKKLRNPKASVSVQFSRSAMSDSLRLHESQHTGPPCPSPIPGVYSNSCPLSRWCHPAISSSVVPSSLTFNPSQHQGLLQWVSLLHQSIGVSSGQSIGVSASASVLPMNIQDWFPLGWTGWISL